MSFVWHMCFQCGNRKSRKSRNPWISFNHERVKDLWILTPNLEQNRQIYVFAQTILKTYKNTNNIIQNNAPNNAPNNTQYSRLNNNNDTFEKQLKEKEDNFQQLISKPVPAKVNFEDENVDKPINIENNLNELKKQRNYIDEKYDVKKNVDELNEKIKKQDDIIKMLAQKINILEEKINGITSIEKIDDKSMII
jgi:hypothetical protein